jgi:hypothetical protein
MTEERKYESKETEDEMRIVRNKIAEVLCCNDTEGEHPIRSMAILFMSTNAGYRVSFQDFVELCHEMCKEYSILLKKCLSNPTDSDTDQRQSETPQNTTARIDTL